MTRGQVHRALASAMAAVIRQARAVAAHGVHSTPDPVRAGSLSQGGLRAHTCPRRFEERVQPSRESGHPQVDAEQEVPTHRGLSLQQIHQVHLRERSDPTLGEREGDHSHIGGVAVGFGKVELGCV